MFLEISRHNSARKALTRASRGERKAWALDETDDRTINKLFYSPAISLFSNIAGPVNGRLNTRDVRVKRATAGGISRVQTQRPRRSLLPGVQTFFSSFFPFSYPLFFSSPSYRLVTSFLFVQNPTGAKFHRAI